MTDENFNEFDPETLWNTIFAAIDGTRDGVEFDDEETVVAGGMLCFMALHSAGLPVEELRRQFVERDWHLKIDSFTSGKVELKLIFDDAEGGELEASSPPPLDP